ncbi:MAG TPA: hypothetical protein VEK86_08105, partial [Gemmatimonadales bacterium]|nr:hypothetical protein [Gemmatimonadales bacterium]
PARERYDRAVMTHRGLDAVRRPTGGRAVWHEHEVTYAVAAPLAALGSLRASYLAIHTRLAAALDALGVHATIAPDRLTARPPDHEGACFAASVGGEVLIDGKKVIGSAQVRRGSAFLQHGSILLDGSQDLITAVSLRPQAASGGTTLSAALGRPVTFHEVAEAVLEAFGRDAGGRQAAPPRPSARPPDRLTAAFLDPAWTWRR